MHFSALFEPVQSVSVDRITNSKKTRESGVTCYVLGVTIKSRIKYI